jgi:hopene-associated glycosyltransferase HpnB
MSIVITVLASLSLVAWLYLYLFRGGFWRIGETLPRETGRRADWPRVIAVVPARNESDVIDRAIQSLMRQEYPGDFGILVVDDHSDDATGEIAQDVAQRSDNQVPVIVVSGGSLPSGWTGKLWALSQGVSRALDEAPDVDFFWFTDADIVHSKTCLQRLIEKAEDEDRDVVSLMVMLSSQGGWSKLLIPPFVYFFRKLYPFDWVNNPARSTAGAAGGCLLVRSAALRNAGGIEAMHHALIDDCTLAKRVQDHGRDGIGRLWLGLTRRSRCIRPYDGLGDIWRMVARSAFTQLNYSPIKLVGVVLGMTLIYLAPPLIALGYPFHLNALASGVGATAWLIMCRTMLPTLKLYGLPSWWSVSLPVAAGIYALMTISSAFSYWRGFGGIWKGRAQAFKQ